MNRRTIALLAVALLAISVAIAGCASAPKQPAEKPGIVGAVQRITPYGNDGVSVLVATDTLTAESKKYVADAAMVNFGPNSVVVDASGERIKPKDIAQGTELSVWFDGPVAESYPVQGTAAFVKVSGSAGKKPTSE